MTDADLLSPAVFDSRPLVAGFRLLDPAQRPTVDVCEDGTFLFVDFGEVELTRPFGPFKAGKQFFAQFDYAAGHYIFWEDDFSREVLHYPLSAALYPVQGADRMSAIRDEEILRLTKLHRQQGCEWTLALIESWKMDV